MDFRRARRIKSARSLQNERRSKLVKDKISKLLLDYSAANGVGFAVLEDLQRARFLDARERNLVEAVLAIGTTTQQAVEKMGVDLRLQ